jgi:hypothetical protein
VRLAGQLGRLVGNVAIGLLLAEVVVRLAVRVPAVWERLPCRVGREALCDVRTYARIPGVTDAVWDEVRGWKALPRARGEVVDGRRLHPDPGADRPDRPRVLLLGDSFTFGDEVGPDVAFAGQLAALRPDLDVWNLGVPGYGHDQVLLTLEAYGPAARPAVVVVGWVALDVERNGLGLTSQPKPWFTLQDGALVRHGVPVPRPTAWARDVELSWWTLAFARGLLQRGVDPEAARARVDDVTLALLDRMAADAGDLGARFLLVRLPTRPDQVPDGPDHPLAAAEALYDRWCAARPGACLDLVPDFRAAWAAGVDTTLGGHWNRDGHALVARRLAEALPASAP